LRAPFADRLDHLVLTVADIEESVLFYRRVLGLSEIRSSEGRVALAFGEQKINLHPVGSAIEPRALRPTPGSADLCFVSSLPIEKVIDHLGACDVPVACGPVARTGAIGPMTSVYFRDPDGNLIELAVYDSAAADGRAMRRAE
jgi:catechol 2,3-dioxygenase-like lactoylglutathione lyase family enzyme